MKEKIDDAVQSGRMEQVKRVLGRLWMQSDGLKSPVEQRVISKSAITMQDWNTAWNEEMKR
ncbi:hypothetical protein D3C84_1233050 [compost metagenome]